jgi:Sulfotransferase domain
MKLFDLEPLSGPRIFGIGFNKTGTTTLGACFDILGLGPVARPQALHDAFALNLSSSVKAHTDLTKDRNAFFDAFPYRSICREVFDHQNYGLALHVASGFRAFHDRPWNVAEFYKVLDLMFPNSYFILTTRSAEQWWQSVDRWLNVNHVDDEEKRYRYLKHLGVDQIEKTACISAYLAHNQGIRNYFEGRSENFLELQVGSNFNWETLCGFLKLPIPDELFPHQNKQLY